MLYTSRTFSYEYDLKEADVVLLGVPFSSTELGNDTKYGPLFIRHALKNTPGYDPELKLNPFAKYRFHDAGDVEIVTGDWKKTEERVIETVKEILSANGKAFPVVLGGEHLITLAVLKALKRFHGDITVVQFDAHADLMKEWMGNKYSHITWAYHALKEGFKVVQIGVRSYDESEIRTLKKVRKFFDKSDVLYLTIDLDVLSTALCRDVGTPEPGGMELKEFMEYLGCVFKNKVVGMDVVECAATHVQSQSAVIAANIIKRALALRWLNEKKG